MYSEKVPQDGPSYKLEEVMLDYNGFYGVFQEHTYEITRWFQY